jgi:hypothetical protein
MSNALTLLSREQIDKINTDAVAAVARGHDALAKAREARARIGLTDEKIQQMLDTLPPDSRAWVSTATRAGLTALSNSGAEAAKARPRRPRSLV